MKRTTLLASLILFLFSATAEAQLFKSKAKAERVMVQCDIPMSQRPIVKVPRFDVTTRRAKNEFGDELATMLSNALVETGCFNVLGGISGMREEDRINMIGGGGDQRATATKRADYFITGSITEFDCDHSTYWVCYSNTKRTARNYFL